MKLQYSIKMNLSGAFLTLVLFSQLGIICCQNTTAVPNTRIFTATSPLQANTDLGICSCDLTSSACDVNCCCDSDCNTLDFRTFSHCSNDYDLGEDFRLCSRASSQRDNPDTALDDDFVRTSLNPSLFCIWTDNYKDRFYYQIPELARNQSAYQMLVDTAQSSYSYEAPPVQPTQPTSRERYSTGQLIYYESVAEIPVLKIPTVSASSSSCMDYNPVQFLKDQSTTCIRHLPSHISQSCETFTPLNPEIFRRTLQSSAINSVPPTGAGIATPVQVNVIGTIQTPVYNKSTCFGLLKQVDIIVTHEVGVITSVDAEFTLIDITGFPTSLEQKYSITFKTPPPGNRTEDDVVKRSGNPGYLIGEPVIAGRINSSETFIILDSDRYNYLTVLKPNADGSCANSSTSRTPVLFGENIRSGCTLQLTDTNPGLSTANCKQFLEAARIALLGPTRTINDDGSIYIASLGNSNHLQVGDWVPLLSNSFPSTGCGVSMDLQILYSYIGDLHNPQARIIGSRLQFSTISVSSQCYSTVTPRCSSRADDSRKFEVVSSVSFIDVSTTPVPFTAEQPVFTLKLPYDFFKPFYRNSARHFHCSITLFLLCFICSIGCH